jgi:hypothetical protein
MENYPAMPTALKMLEIQNRQQWRTRLAGGRKLGLK